MSTYRVGEVRPSQLLWTYGPGALIDLPNLSVVTMGLDYWDEHQCVPIEEARLLAAVQRKLGSQVERLRMPPFCKDENVDPMSAEGKIGVPVKPFPRWLRCVKCGLLAEYDSGLFNIKSNPYRPELTHFVHTNCEKGLRSDAVPARFLLACKNGHLDDFPWHWFVHGGKTDCKGTLRFFESGASLQTQNLWVKCDTCEESKSLVHAFGKEGKKNLPSCRGRHPHLDSYDQSCDEEPRPVLLGATNSWFPITLSALAIPLEKNPLDQLVADGWDYFKDVESEQEANFVSKTLLKTSTLPDLAKYTSDEIWNAIKERKEGKNNQEYITETEIKVPEWQVLTANKVPSDWPHFLSRREEVPTIFSNEIEDVLLLERLREVNALIGYTRVEAIEEYMDDEIRPNIAKFTKGAPKWIPASEVHGEGIFIKFNLERIVEWEKRGSVIERSSKLFAGHKGWRNARKLNPNEGFPGIRFTMLHTFAHLLIRELALECGYNEASIRERIYAEQETSMAGVLIYTAAADSDGTLGGLVELGKPENLGRLIEQALNRSIICSSDPMCSEHDPSKDRSLHGASCHACSFVAETSCEKGNRYLDRALLVSTLDDQETAFFKGRNIINE